MYGRKKNTLDEQRFFQLLLRELRHYAQNGARIYAEQTEVSPQRLITDYIARYPGQYMAEIDRDETGTVLGLYFFRAASQDFDKNGRFLRNRKSLE